MMANRCLGSYDFTTCSRVESPHKGKVRPSADHETWGGQVTRDEPPGALPLNRFRDHRIDDFAYAFDGNAAHISWP